MLWIAQAYARVTGRRILALCMAAASTPVSGRVAADPAGVLWIGLYRYDTLAIETVTRKTAMVTDCVRMPE